MIELYEIEFENSVIIEKKRMFVALLLYLFLNVNAQCTGTASDECTGSVCCQNCRFFAMECDDQSKCTKNDMCDVAASKLMGKLVRKGIAACPVAPDTCTKFNCDPNDGTCVKQVAPDGSACGNTGS